MANPFGPPAYSWSGGVDLYNQKSAVSDFYRLTSVDAGLVSTGINVAGTQNSQLLGYQLAATTSWFSIVGAGGACVLPQTSEPFSLSGAFIQILNTSANPLLVYPHPADQPNSINNGPLNASVTVLAGQYMLLHCFAPGMWAASAGSSGLGGVSSVFGRSGVVAAANNDYAFSQLSGTVAIAQLPTSIPLAAITWIMDGGGVALVSGISGELYIPFDCTIQAATMLADQSGNFVLDIWKQVYANYPPNVTNTITAAALPTLTAASKYQDNTLVGWTTTINSGDVLRFNINSAATVTRVALTLTVKKR